MSSTDLSDEERDPVRDPDDPDSSLPWQQRFYQKIWLWAGAAILFWFLSYVVWGWVDLLLLPEG